MTPSSTSTKQAFAGARSTTDDAAHTANNAIEQTRAYANEALDSAEGKVRELRGTIDPLVDVLATKAQKLARQSLDLASEAKHKAQQSLTRYADVTTKYVSEQPMRSVLIAAAVGAAVALLVASTRNQNRY